MSQHQRNQSTHFANLTGIILVVTFVVIFPILAANLPGNPADDVAVSEDNRPIEALVIPTQTVTLLTPEPTAAEVAQVATQAQPVPVNTANYDPALVSQGEQLFLLCSACHGADGRGLPNLGKDLVESEFVAGLSDADLMTFIITGRPIWDPLNTTGIDMPGKGGNPAMTNEQIQAIIAYIRTLQTGGAASVPASGNEVALAVETTPTEPPTITPIPPTPAPTTVPATSMPEPTTAAVTEVATQAQPVPVNTANYDPALVSQGEQLFLLCSACHGADGRGLPNLGKDLVESEFVAGLSDADLMTFIITGRPIWDPLNTTGIDMPGKGGNPAMTNEQIQAIIAYIRTLSANAGG
mgnify:CR=1 FL=1